MLFRIKRKNAFILSVAITVFACLIPIAHALSQPESVKSYTKLDQEGNYTLGNDFVMVRDNDTGLIWEVKTNDSTIHSRDATRGELSLITDSFHNVTEEYYGHSDWRIPSVEELVSIVKYQKLSGYGAFDETYFPNTQVGKYLAFNPDGENGGELFTVDFDSGKVSLLDPVEDPENIYWRVVRNDKPNPEVRYIKPDDKIIIDTVTGLMWFIEPDTGMLSQADASTYCESLVYKNFNDWRLPDVNELASLITWLNEYQNPIAAWSSTERTGSNNLGWVVEFDTSEIRTESSSAQYNVLAVRGKPADERIVPETYRVSVHSLQPDFGGDIYNFKFAEIELPGLDLSLILPAHEIFMEGQENIDISIPFYSATLNATGQLPSQIDINNLAHNAIDGLLGFGDYIIFSEENIANVDSVEFVDFEVAANKLYVAGNLSIFVGVLDRSAASMCWQDFCQEYQNCIVDDACNADPYYDALPPEMFDDLCSTDMGYFDIYEFMPFYEFIPFYYGPEFERLTECFDCHYMPEIITIPFLLIYRFELRENGFYVGVVDNPEFLYNSIIQEPHLIDGLRIIDTTPISNDDILIKTSEMGMEYEFIYHPMNGTMKGLTQIFEGQNIFPHNEFSSSLSKTADNSFEYYELGKTHAHELSFYSINFDVPGYNAVETFFVQLDQDVQATASADNYFATIENAGDNYRLSLLEPEVLKNGDFFYSGTLLFNKEKYSLLDIVSTNERAYLFGKVFIEEENTYKSSVIKVDISDPENIAITETIHHEALDEIGEKIDGFSVTADKILFAYNNASKVLVLDKGVSFVEAGFFQSVIENTTVTLSGNVRYSFPAGNQLLWEQISGPVVEIENPNAASISFAVPEVGIYGEYLTFRLTVTDGSENQGQDTVTVYVQNENKPPEAVIDNPDGIVADEQTLVTLIGENSHDDDGIVTYLWEQVSGPKVNIIDPTQANAQFTTPDVVVGGADLKFKLTVKDHHGKEHSATCNVTVLWVNAPPKADAGSDIEVSEGADVQLSADRSTDFDDGIESYSWGQTGGTPVMLVDASTDHPHFTAPLYNPEGDLVFTLTVKDSHGLESTDECVVRVIDATLPEEPTEIKTEFLSRDTIRLTWVHSTSNDVSHYIIYSNNGSGEIDFSAPFAIIGSAESYFEITDLSDGTYKFIIRSQDHYGNIEQNETSFTSRSVQPVCELEPGAFFIDQGTILETDVLQITVVVKNSGDGTAQNVPIGIYRNAIEAENLIYSNILTEIPASGTAEFSFPYDTAGKLGENTLYLAIDSQNEIFEFDIENNSATLSFVVLERADLYFQEPVQVTGGNFYEGSELTVSGTVVNNGDIAVNNVEVHFFLDNLEQINAIGEKAIATLAPGTTETVSVNWNSTEYPGTRTVYAVIDLADTIGEKNEGNNTSQFSMNIENPVLTVQLKSPDNIEAGTEAEFEIHYSNSSSISAENVFIDLNLPEGITINSSDTAFYNETNMVWNIGSISEGADGIVKFSIFADYSMPDNNNVLWDIILDYVNPNNVQMDQVTRSRNITVGEDVTAPGFILNVSPAVIRTGIVQIKLKSHEPLSSPPELTVKDSNLYPLVIRLVGEDNVNNEYLYEVEVDDTVEEGQVYIDVKGDDLSGNSGTSLAGVSIDRTPPVISIQSPEYGTNTFTASLTFNETLIEAPQINFTDIAGNLIDVGESEINGSEYLYNIVLPQDLQEGASNFAVTAKDKAGNVAYREVNPILDLKDPGLTITAPEFAGIGAFDFNIQIDEPIKGYPVVSVLDSLGKQMETFSISSNEGHGYRTIVQNNTNEGNACIIITIEDVSGRKTTLQKCLNIDNTKPEFEISVDNESKPESTIITVVSKEALYGLPEIDVILGSGESVEPVFISQSGDTYTFELSEKNIIHVYAEVEDTAGNRIANRVSLVDVEVLENSINFSSIPGNGGDVEITASIYNSSSSTNIENVKINFIDAAGNNEIGSRIVDIPAGQITQTSIIWDADLQQAQHLIYVYVDPDYEIFETNETNNIGLKGTYSLHINNFANSYVDNLDYNTLFNVQVKRLADSSLMDDSFVELHFAIIDEDGDVVIDNQPMLYNPSQSTFESSFDPSSLLDIGKYKVVISGEDTLGGNPIFLEKDFSVINDFSVTVTTDHQVVDRHNSVEFSGNVQDVEGGGIENAKVELYLKMKDGTRKFIVYTNEDGDYAYDFTPSSSEAGNYILTTRVTVEGIQREASSSFSILGLYLAPSLYNLSFSANDRKEKTYKIYNLGEEPITGLNIEIQDTDENDNVISSLDTTNTSTVIAPGGKTTFKIIFESTSEESVSNAEILTTVTTDQLAVETGKSIVTTKTALPDLNISKTNIETVLNLGSTKREIITVTNTGHGTIHDLYINTEELPYWISINREPYVGTVVARGSDQDYGFGFQPDYGLIGKVGENGESFYIGSLKSLTSDEEGELYLRINEHDSQLYDNTGEINITVNNAETLNYTLDPSTGWANTHQLITTNRIFQIQSYGLWESSGGIYRNTEGMGSSTFSIVINPDKQDLLSNEPYDKVIKLTSSNYSTSYINLRNWVKDILTGDVEINVSNIINETVGGAEVTLFDQTWDPVSQSYRVYTVATDENGKAVFGGIHTGNYKYMVRAQGHAGITDELTVGPGDNRVDIRNLVRELVTVDFQVYELDEALKLAEEGELELIDDYDDVQRDTYEVEISTYYYPVDEEGVLPPVIHFEPRILFEKLRPGQLKRDQFVITNSGNLTAFIDQIIVPGSFDEKTLDNFYLEISEISGIKALQDGLQPNERVSIPYSIDAKYATFGDNERGNIEFEYHFFIDNEQENTSYNELSGKAGISMGISTEDTFLTTLPKSITIYNKCSGENVFKIGQFDEQIVDFSVTNNSSYYGNPTTVLLTPPSYLGFDILGLVKGLTKIGEKSLEVLSKEILKNSSFFLGEFDDYLLNDTDTSHGSIDIKSLESKLIDLNLFPTLEMGGVSFAYLWDDPNENKINCGTDSIPVITVGEGCLARGLFETITYIAPMFPEGEDDEDEDDSPSNSSGGGGFEPFSFAEWGGGVNTPHVIPPKPAIKFELSHEITMERDLFLAQLILSNGLEEYQIEDFSMHIEISDESGNIIMQTQEADGPLWFREPKLKNITSIDGSGLLEPKEQGIVEWLIVPKSDSGGEVGREYALKVFGSFKVNGEEFTFDDIKGNVVDTITVKPQPKLKLDYYLPTNVKADEPFYLILDTKNVGHGTARKVMIDENGTAVLNLRNGYFDREGKFWFGCVETDEYGYVISNTPDCGVVHANFTFEDKYLNGEGETNVSMKTDLGDIEGGSNEIAYWKLTSNHDGYFSDIDVQFSHIALGGRETSLIDDANIHYYDKIVNVFIDGKYVKCAFTDMKLIRMDTGDVINVTPAKDMTVGDPDPYNPVLSLTLNKEDGFTYIDIQNPYGYLHQLNISIDSIKTGAGLSIDSSCFWFFKDRIHIIGFGLERLTVNFEEAADSVTTKVAFDKSKYYGLNDEAQITVVDNKIDSTPGPGNDMVQVTVSTSLEPGGEIVELMESSDEEGRFVGKIGFENNLLLNNGNITVGESSLIKVLCSFNLYTEEIISSAFWFYESVAGDSDGDGVNDADDLCPDTPADSSVDEKGCAYSQINHDPVAAAGPDQIVDEGGEITLNGSNSHDPDGDSLTYLWEQITPETPLVDILDPTSAETNFYAPNVDSSGVALTFKLTITDPEGLSSVDKCIVNVGWVNDPPVADAGGPYLATPGTEVLLDASGSYDPNQKSGSDPILTLSTASGYDEIVLYQWDLDSDGLYGTEDSPSEPEGVKIVVDLGNFIGNTAIALKVTDSFGNSSENSIALDTVAFSNIYPISYELATKIYNRRTGQWTVGYRVNIFNEGDGSAIDVTARLLQDSIPIAVDVVEDTVRWTNPDNSIESGEIQLSDGEFKIVYPRTIGGPDVSKITWELFYTDDLGAGNVIKSIPQ